VCGISFNRSKGETAWFDAASATAAAHLSRICTATPWQDVRRDAPKPAMGGVPAARGADHPKRAFVAGDREDGNLLEDKKNRIAGNDEFADAAPPDLR